ncbi:MAG: DUF4124 domain-containing protein [Methylophilaceae bacterium]|jgi:hypothetical protein|uniref:DUF4124 domain-containing protein n=1 Tax=Methylobacillus sp. MM3 TaxID=1848039 RepID=UPI0009EE6A2F|nr:DUF4124 domain-containing protein [Methylobacillus sp. MM3]
MRTLFVILMLLIPLPGLADIYKCKDSRQMMVYQDTPCATRTIGTLKPVPAPSDKDVTEARRNLERTLQENRYYEQLRRQELAKKQEEQRLLEAQELRERELMAAEAYQDENTRYYPLYAPGFGHEPFARRHRHPHGNLDPIKPIPRRPCVIGFVGDTSCR